MTQTEPSVLDYVKYRLRFRRGAFQWPAADAAIVVEQQAVAAQPEAAERSSLLPVLARAPWRSLGALFVALIAQRSMEPPADGTQAAALYALAGFLMIWALSVGEWQLPELRAPAVALPISTDYRAKLLWPGLGLAALAFLALGGNEFNSLNILFWLGAVSLVTAALWQPMASWRERLRESIHRLAVIRITPFFLLALTAVLVVVFFRLWQLNQVPGEMFSDQAEKLLDVGDVLAGHTPIFFVRNTGREALQFYWTAAIAQLLGTGLSFISLKIGTALLGLFALPFIYLLGKELGGRWLGLAAFLLAGIAYWPNVISRVGLRFPLYPAFAAPALYFLVRGLRQRSRNDFLLAGLFLGIGLHGYSAYRLMPVILAAVVAVYLLHRQSHGNRLQAVWAFAALALVTLLVFLPLVRYIFDDPSGSFGLRALSRLGQAEREYPGPVGSIFLSNLWKAWLMPFWSNGIIWVHSVPFRPALDVVSAGLYFFGSLLLVVRYVRQRDWEDLFLLVSVPLLMLPSILSLAFPEENPSLNRTGGAIVPVFIIAAYGLTSLVRGLASRAGSRAGRTAAFALAAVLLLLSVRQNYDLVFNRYRENFALNAWNNSEMGEVIRSFAGSQGNVDTAYVVPYPYWVDTRLVGMSMGLPYKDYALWRDDISTTLAEPRAKLFLVYPEDQPTVRLLSDLYPQGALYRYSSPTPGKDFLMFFVPPQPFTGPGS